MINLRRVSISQYIIASIALLNVLLHLVFYNTFEYHRDELLYFTLGNHPAAGYATTPPLIGIIAWLLIKTMGYSLFAVKIIPAIFSGIMVILAAAISRELGGKSYAQVLTAVAILVQPIVLRGFFLFQPVFLDVFLWSLGFYYLLRYLNTDHSKFLILLGIVAGLGMLNKYLIALLILGIITGLLVTKFRTLFRERNFYYAIAAGFLIFLPNIIWQLVHGMPVIGHMRELNDTQLVYMEPGDFLFSQLFLLFATSLLALPGLAWLLVSGHTKKWRMVGWISLYVLVALILFRGKSYYTAGIFPVLIAAGAVFWERLVKWKLVLVGIMAFMVLITYPILPMGIPIYKPERMIEYFRVLEEEKGMDVGRRWEDDTIHPLPQDYADMLGWEELTSLARQAYDSVLDKEACVIYAQNYGQAGAISVIGKKYNMPEAMSFHDSFRYWLPKDLKSEIREFIYINDELGEDIQDLFSNIQVIGSISNPYAREYGTTVYLCREPTSSFNAFYKRIYEERVGSD